MVTATNRTLRLAPNPIASGRKAKHKEVRKVVGIDLGVIRMTELEKIRKMSADEMTTHLVRILSCKRCFCAEICEQIKASNGAKGKAPCAVAVKAFLERKVKNDNVRK